jgi:hypothetical protein
VEWLKVKVLSSSPSTTKKKKNQKQFSGKGFLPYKGREHTKQRQWTDKKHTLSTLIRAKMIEGGKENHTHLQTAGPGGCPAIAPAKE